MVNGHTKNGVLRVRRAKARPSSIARTAEKSHFGRLAANAVALPLLATLGISLAKRMPDSEKNALLSCV
jgi:hypothetical protein